VKIAVVIPALDEAERVVGAVESAVGPNVDVVVVDGGSRDGTPERAAAVGATVIASAPGRARQLQAGLRHSDGDAVVFLHADTRLPRGFAEAIRESLSDPRVVGGAFRLRFDDRRLRMRAIEWGARLRVALLGLPYGDQALFARRRALEGIGGVPQAPIMEDLDLVEALRGRGRFATLRLPATTSSRRYRQHGVLRTMLRNWAAAAAWRLGLDRDRVAARYRR
jgi:rSAM/selenodomain-associated transferase 2